MIPTRTGRHAMWRKATYSGQQSSCVEVAAPDGEIGVRDTRAKATAHVGVTAVAWDGLLDKLKG